MRASVIAMLLLVSAPAFADASVPAVSSRARRIRPVGYIVPASRGAEFYGGSHALYFTPSQREVDALEDHLAAYLKSIHAGYERPLWQRLGGFARQYVGIIVNGKRRIWVNTYWIDKTVFRASAVSRPFGVDDGGDDFWRVTYDPRTQTFSDFNTNGLG